MNNSFFVLAIISIVLGVSLSNVEAAEYIPIWNSQNYHIGEFAVITVKDAKQNDHQGLQESLEILVTSDSDSVGQKITLIETENNSGYFSGKILLSSEKTKNSILVREGDFIYAQNEGYVKSAKVESAIKIVASPIVVASDKQEYTAGEKILISGKQSHGDPKFPVTLEIKDPNGKTVFFDYLFLSYELRFETQIDTDSPLWKDSGNYMIKATSSQGKIAEDVFLFGNSARSTGNSIKIYGKTVSLDYSLTSGKMLLVRPNTESNSLIFSIETASGGQFTVNLPYKIIDASSLFGKEEFTILVDGKKSQYVEKTTTTGRVLTIPYNHRTTTIEIQGTSLQFPTNEFVAFAEQTEIPSWIRNNAEWWSKGLIDDQDFVSGIEYLASQDIIFVPKTNSDTASSANIPNWVKNNAGWWASGQMTDQDFVNSIQYLVKKGIVRV